MSTPSPLVRETAAYLQTLRAQLVRASQSRKGWISQVGLLLADLQHGTSRDVVAAVAGRSGAAHRETFAQIRADLARVEPAPGCETCHLAVLGWLDKQIAACDLMIEIGQTGLVERLREVRGLIAEARHDARLFNYEMAERAATLRHRRAAVAAASRAPQPRPPGRTTPAGGARPAPATGPDRGGSLLGRVARLFGRGDDSDLIGLAG
jgi:hypothetical protein